MKKYLLLISIAVFTILSYSSFAQTSTALLGPDVGVSAIISPASTAPTNPTPVPISLEVKNYGTTKSTSFMVFVVIDGSVQPPYLYTDTLSQGGVDTVSFGSTMLPSSPVYICAYTVLTGDIDNTNDTSCVMVNGIIDVELTKTLGVQTNMSNPSTIGTTIKNSSSTPITNCTVKYYTLSGGVYSSVTSQAFNGLINPGDSIDFYFTTQFTGSIGFSGNLIFFIDSIQDDINNNNDTISEAFQITTGIASSINSANNCLIYPQPADKSVTVKWKGHQIVSYQLTDLQGRNLISIDRIQSEKFIVDVSLLAPGIYIIQLFDGTQRVKTKLIVKH